MSERRRSSLTAPPGSAMDVPTVARPAEAWRAHLLRPGSAGGAWWYSSTPDGRFDLPLPRGTCYLASDAQSALRERLGPTLAGVGSVETADLDNVGVSRLAVPRGRALADTIAPDAVKVPGLTREVCTSVDYPLTRAWAAYFLAQHCGGVRYSARHTTALDSLSYALFGVAGSRAARPRDTLDARVVALAAGLQIVTEYVPDADLEVIEVR